MLSNRIGDRRAIENGRYRLAAFNVNDFYRPEGLSAHIGDGR